MTDSNSGNWTVEITTTGRCGKVIYREGRHEAFFDWEFGGGDVVAIISIGSADAWNTEFPWAADRRPEVGARLAAEVIRQKATTCVAAFDETWGSILLRERKNTG